MFVSKPNQTTTKADATQQTKKQQRKQTTKPTTRATHKTAVPFVQHLGSSSHGGRFRGMAHGHGRTVNDADQGRKENKQTNA